MNKSIHHKEHEGKSIFAVFVFLRVFHVLRGEKILGFDLRRR